MQERLKTLLPSQWNRIPVTTFHALGLTILQENRVAAGLPRGFRVVSDLEREKALVESLQCSTRKTQRILREISRLKRNDLQPDSAQDLQTAWS